MPIMFNQLLRDAGMNLSKVRLLRHSITSGRSIIDLWHNDRSRFDLFQSIQAIGNRSKFDGGDYWASFGNTLDGGTLFLGLYRVSFVRIGQKDIPQFHREGTDAAGTYHLYSLTEAEEMKDLAGRLSIEWGSGTRSWIQRPDRQDKPVIEVRKAFREPDFPGYVNFIQSLSKIEVLPAGWKDALRSAKGVYLLTCPKTNEQYVGKADGSDGFLGRWLNYVSNNHGGNLGLKSRDPSDYQVSILEVAGSAATFDDILDMEALWKQKLQSREMGLNRN